MKRSTRVAAALLAALALANPSTAYIPGIPPTAPTVTFRSGPVISCVGE